MRHPLRNRARALRRDQTEPEYRMWLWLRGRRMCGFKFRRQVPVGPYFADFACRELKLIIELDGGGHVQKQAADGRRTAWLENRGWTVLRVWNLDFHENRQDVL